MGSQTGDGKNPPSADASGSGRQVEVVELDEAVLDPTGQHAAGVPPGATPGAAPPAAINAAPTRASVPPPKPPAAARRVSMPPPPPPSGTAAKTLPLGASQPPAAIKAAPGAGAPGRPVPPLKPGQTLHGVMPPAPRTGSPPPTPGSISRPAMEAVRPPTPGTVPTMHSGTPSPAAKRLSRPPPAPPGNSAAAAVIPPAEAPPATPAIPSDELPWLTLHDRLGREADAVAVSLPARAALLLTAQARVALDIRGNIALSDAALARAAALCPDARFVATSRRWAAERRGKPSEVLALARAELPLVGDPRERTGLLAQIAAIEEHSSGQPDAAEKTLREAVALDPQDVSAWEALAALFARRKQWKDTVAAWEGAAAATDDALVKAALYTASASVREVNIDDVPGALACLKRAIELDPTSVAALAAIEPLHLRARAWIDYARTIVSQGDQVGDPAAARECYERAGDVLWECANDAASAAACYERAAVMAPREVAPLEKFAAVLEGSGRHADLPRVYERLLQVLREPLQQAAVLLRLGSLYDTRLEKPEEALRAYRRALEASPTFLAAAQSLATSYRAAGKWAELVQLESSEADRVTNPVQRAVRYVAVADLYETRLDDIDSAVALYDRARALDPTNTAAFDALDRIYRIEQKWAELIALYEKLATTVKDPRRVRATNLQLAALLHERGGQPERAALLLRSALHGEQDSLPTLISLSRALADAGNWSEYVDVLEAQSKLLRDDEDLVSTLYRIGMVIESRLNDPRRALAAYQRVLERAPRHELALQGLVRVHQGQGRYEDVAATERKLLEIAGRAEDGAATLYRIGRIAEERLGRPDEAIKAYEEALLRLPAYAPALSALERLLRATGKFARLAEMFERLAETSRDQAQKARLLCQCASVHELHLNDPTRAALAFEKALTVVAGLDAALWGLVRIRESRAEWAAVETALQALLKKTTHSGARLRLLVRLARVQEFRLNQPPRAAMLYGEALELGSPAAPLAIDRLRVARAEGKRETVSHWLEHIASGTKDPRLALSLLRLRALATEYGGGTAQDAADAYAAALGFNATDASALDGLARNLARGESSAKLPQAIRSRARIATDTSTRALLLFVAGAIHDRAGQSKEAEAAYAESVEASADFLPAIDGMRRAREAANDWPAVATLAVRTGALSKHPTNIADALLEAADILSDRLSDPKESLVNYRAVLKTQPSHPRAFARAIQLLEAEADWRTSVEVIGAHVDAISDNVVRARLLAARATMFAERLGEPAAAIVDMQRALGLRNEEPALLGMLARLHEREQHWQDAAQLYERLGRAAPEGALRREAALAQARIWMTHVRDYDRARLILQDAVRMDPTDRTAMMRLAEVSALAGDHTRARDLYQELSRAGAVTDRARALLALAEIYRGGLNDLPASHAAAGEAFLLATSEPAIVAVIDEHFTRTEDFGAYATLGDEAVARVPPTIAGVLPLRLALARVYREKLRALDAADTHLRQAIEAFPQASEPRIALAYGLLGGNDHAAVAELRRVIDLDPTSVMAFRGLLQVCQRMGLTGASTMLASTVALLGDTGPQIEVALATTHTGPLAVASPLASDDALQLLVGATRARFVRRVLAVLDPFLHELLPAGQESLGSFPRLPDSHAAVVTARAVAAGFGISSLALHRGTARDAILVMSEPRALVLGPEHLTDAGKGRVVFDAAHSCARIAAHSTLGWVLPPDQVQAVLECATDAVADGPGYKELRKRIGNVLPRRARKDIERIVDEDGGGLRREWAAWDDEERKRALRSAVLFCRDLRVVAQVIAPDALAATTLEDRRRMLAAHGAVVDALRFAASEACWTAHRRVFGVA